MTEVYQISIRSLQHYLYCPHRWGLIEIGKMWEENYFVVKANLLHEKVHTPSYFKAHNGKEYTSVSVWNVELELYGITDCIEERETGLCIVEYKPKKPPNGDYRADDAIQVFAQKICAEYVFGKHCDKISLLS